MRRSRPRAIALAAALLLVLAAAGWTLVRVVPALWATPPPPPSRDEARDLEPLPGAAENGWTVIASAPPGTFSDLEGPADDLLRPGEGPPPRDALERVGEEVIAWWVPEPTLARIDEALQRPRFALACPLDADVGECSPIAWYFAHRVAASHTIRDTLLGWDDEALERTERLLRADRDAIATARSLIELMVAVAGARQSIELTGLVGSILGAREEAFGTPELRARLDLVELALASLEPEGWSAERALIGESIRTRRALESVAQSGEVAGLGHAMESFDRYFEDAIAYARSRDRALAPDPVEVAHGWALLDPVGASASDIVRIDAVSQIDRLASEAEQARDRVAVARVALAAARARLADDAHAP